MKDVFPVSDGVEKVKGLCLVSLWQNTLSELCLNKWLKIPVRICQTGRKIGLKRSLQYFINVKLQTIPPVTDLLFSPRSCLCCLGSPVPCLCLVQPGQRSAQNISWPGPLPLPHRHKVQPGQNSSPRSLLNQFCFYISSNIKSFLPAFVLEEESTSWVSELGPCLLLLVNTSHPHLLLLQVKLFNKVSKHTC